ncbi:MAG: DUF2007 domain-containing protein [Pirellulales bacterium]|nr:DUF2007 domain-containing protein [Pirellulales bacterium]
MEDRQVVVYVAGSTQQAHMLKNRLAEQGIQAVVTNAALEKGSGVDYVGWATLPRVVVDEKDATLARRIALSHDCQGTQMALQGQPLEDDEDTDVGSKSLPDAWPRCPECNSPRITQCPICKTTGIDFPEADDEFVWGMGLDEVSDEKRSCASCATCGGHGSTRAVEDHESGDSADEPDDPTPERLVLMCPTCSEPFLPEFPRRCAWCDHEFDEGFESDQIVQPLVESNNRVVAIGVGLLILGAIVLGYFWFVV